MNVATLLIFTFLCSALGDIWNPAVRCSQRSEPYGQKLFDYICSTYSQTYGLDKCYPQWRVAKPSAEREKGLVVLFHGFTACPQQYNQIADKLQEQGYYVFVPTIVGHGRPRFPDGLCPMGTDCVQGFDLSGLPTNYTGYEQFVLMVNDIVQDLKQGLRLEEDAPIMVGGLSLGAAMATYASATGMNEDRTPLYSKLLIVNPFFEVGHRNVDEAVERCQSGNMTTNQCFTQLFFETLGYSAELDVLVRNQLIPLLKVVSENVQPKEGDYNYLIRNLFRIIAEEPSLIGVNYPLVTDVPMSFGERCFLNVETSAGICIFKTKHLFGIHSFGQLALSKSLRIKQVKIQAVLTEDDGKAGASYAATAVNNILAEKQNVLELVDDTFVPQDKDVSASSCIYRNTCRMGEPVNSSCLVPHSAISYYENVNLPGHGFWLEKLHQNIADWFTGEIDRIGEEQPEHFLDKNVCEEINTAHEIHEEPYQTPAADGKYVIGSVPSVTTFEVQGNQTGGYLHRLAFKNALIRSFGLNETVPFTGMYVYDIQHSSGATVKYYVEVHPKHQEALRYAIERCEAANCIMGYSLVNSNMYVTDEDSDRLSKGEIAAICIGVIAVVLLVLVAVVVLARGSGGSTDAYAAL